MFQVGDLIAGKYRIERALGEGGMGIVVLARHEQLDQLVAIKCMHLRPGLPDDAVTRFLREARAVAKLRGENVARVIDVDTLDDGIPYIVMEYLEGRDLSDVLDATQIALPDAVDYVLQACVALAEAHAQGIVHRDLKPANLFLTHKPDGSPLVKVLDFGVSKLRTEDDPASPTTRTGTIMGSPLYMPPEQARSSKDVDHRADIWALGAVLYKLLSRQPPFNADNVADLFVKILYEPHPPLSSVCTSPPELDAVIDRCLAKKPEERFQGLGDLAVALGPFASPDGARLVNSVLRLSGDARATRAGQRASLPGDSEVPSNTTVPIAHAISASVGGGTQHSLAVTGQRKPSKTPWLLGAAGAVVLLAGASALIVASASHRNASSNAGLPPSAVAPPAASDAPPPEPAASETKAPEVAPTVSASATPEASASAPPSPEKRPVATKTGSKPTSRPTPPAPEPTKPPAKPAKPDDPFGTMQ
jgi:serine/threonine protein kinase